MAEDNNIIENNDTTPDVTPETIEHTTPANESEFMSDTLDFIKKAQHSNIDEPEDTSIDDPVSESRDEPVSEVVDSDLAGTDIPDSFSLAAEASGMSAGDIIDFASTRSNDELEELIPYLQSTDKEEEVEEKEIVEPETTETPDTPSIPDNADLEKQITEKITKDIEEKFGVSLQEIKDFKVAQEEQTSQQTYSSACVKFDEASKEFPIFGKTDELPKFTTGKLAGQFVPTSPAVKARLEVAKYADGFMGLGQSVDESMDNALATYKGKHMGKEIERNLIRDLKRHEQKLSGSRTGKETQKQYSDSREEMLDGIRQLQRAAGVDV